MNPSKEWGESPSARMTDGRMSSPKNTESDEDDGVGVSVKSDGKINERSLWDIYKVVFLQILIFALLLQLNMYHDELSILASCSPG